MSPPCGLSSCFLGGRNKLRSADRDCFEENNGNALLVKLFKESSLMEESMGCYRIDIFKVCICMSSENIFRATKAMRETDTTVRAHPNKRLSSIFSYSIVCEGVV